MNTAVAPGNVRLDIRPLSPVFGAEVHGVDLSQPLDGERLHALYDVFLRYQLLAFPDQALSDEQHVAFARHWGKLQVHVLNQYQDRAHPEIFVLTNLDAHGRPKGEHPDPGSVIWHTDGSWARERGLATMLYSMAIPSGGGGETWYADMYSAYQALPEDLKALLEGKRAIHDLNYSRSRTGARQQMTEDQRHNAPPVAHEIVRVHPETGRKALYLGEHASHIEGMGLEEGRALIDRVNRLATRDEHLYCHRWQLRQFVIWDNRCLLHKATDFDWMNDKRIIRRTTTVGERLPL